MGGKKKGGKKKGGKKKAAVEEAPKDPKEVERIQLAAECKRLAKLKDQEEAQFNECQQQKEKLNYFWIVEKKNLEDKRAELRNKEREQQDLDEKHQVEIKVYKQRVKHLLYEHQNETTQLKTSGQVALKLSQDEHRDSESELRRDERALKRQLKELELAHEDYLRTLNQEQDKNITRLRLDFEHKVKELHLKYETIMRNVRSELEADRKAEIQRIEDRKNAHIAHLMQAHEKAFAEIKNYYNDITHSNLDLIKSLKEDVAKLKKAEATDEKMMFEIAQENKRMSEPLKQALSDVERLQAEREAHQQDVSQLEEVKARLLVGTERLKGLQWEHEVLGQRHERAQKEHDELYDEFQRSLYSVQQKTGFKNLLLERKLEAADVALEKKEAQLSEVLSSAQLEPSVVGTVNKHVEELIDAKDGAIRELQGELSRVTAAHNQLIAKCEEDLSEYGVPLEELGFEPIREGGPFSTTAVLAEKQFEASQSMTGYGAGAGAGTA